MAAAATWDLELRTLVTMLHDRGYTQIKPVYHGEDPVLLCTCKEPPKGETVLVFLSHEPKVGVKTLRKIKSDSSAAGSKHFILLSRDGLTPFAARELQEGEAEMDIEIFKQRDLCMAVTHHSLVPTHTPLTKAQKSQLLSELGCKAQALPKLKESDPVARYLHLTPGTVVKIVRRVGALEAEPYFRVVT